MIARKNHTVYMKSLNLLVDALFEEAKDQEFTLATLVKKSGLSYGTIKNLYLRKTKYPQYRTVELLALSLGGKVAFDSEAWGQRERITWTPKVFAAA